MNKPAPTRVCKNASFRFNSRMKFKDQRKSDVDFPKYVLQNLHLDVETADVNFTFVVVDSNGAKTTKKLPAHKNILASGSAVFRSMFFTSALKETSDIAIEDFSHDGFAEFISLFYSCDTTLNKENIYEVIRAIDKYDARRCLPRCEKFLEDTMNEDIACDILEIAMKVNLSQMIIELVEIVIGENTNNIFRSKGFQCCDKSVLSTILQMENLSCANELAVFKAAMDWADHSCRQKGQNPTDVNKRTELGECFQLIRFTAMSQEEFLELNEIYPDVFKYEEFKEMLQFKIRGRPLKLFANFNLISRTFVGVKPTPENIFTGFKFGPSSSEKSL